MSAFDERFKSHPVHQALADVREDLRKLKTPRKAVEVTDARQRLGRALEHVQAVLATADPELAPSAVLDAIHQQVDPMRTQIQYAENEDDPDYLNTANQHADAMLHAVAGIVRLVAPEDVERLQESATSFRQSAGQLLRHFREDADEVDSVIEQLRSSTTELREEIEAQKGRLDQALNEQQGYFTDAQTERDERFKQAQEEHAQAMQGAIADAEQRLDQVVARSDKRVEDLDSELTRRAEALLGRIAKLESDAKRQVDTIGIVGMSGGYQEVADKEEKQANLWRWLAAASAGLAIALNIVVVLATAFGWIEEEFEWDQQVPRILVTLSLLAFASYAGVESSRHRRRQEVNRQMEKELASLEPYMALFSDNEKKAMKREKFDLFFEGRQGRPVSDLPPPPPDGERPDGPDT